METRNSLFKTSIQGIQRDLVVTGGSLGIIGTNIAYGRSWHQYCCSDCHNAFKVRLGVCGNVKEIKKF